MTQSLAYLHLLNLDDKEGWVGMKVCVYVPCVLMALFKEGKGILENISSSLVNFTEYEYVN